VAVIDGVTDSVLHTIAVGREPWILCSNPGRDKVYCASWEAGCVTVIDGQADTIIAVVPTGPRPSALCYNSRDDKVYCASHENGSIAVIDGLSDSIVATVTGGSWPEALCYNSVSNRVYCADLDSCLVFVIDGASDSVVARVDAVAYSLCYDSASNRVYCIDQNRWEVSVVDGATNTVVARLTVGMDPRAAVWLPSGNRVYVANRFGSSISVIRDSMVGVRETGENEAHRVKAATLIRDVLVLPRDMTCLGPDPDSPGGIGSCPALLLDAVGRKVLSLAPGQNDVRDLAPGVYFVRTKEQRDRGIEGSSVRKVVVTR